MKLNIARRKSVRTAVQIALCAALATVGIARADDSLRARVDDAQRSETNRARDVYRHPYETLSFFGLRDDETVIEIWPGGAAWWTEILAPWLHDHGHYVAALPPDAASDEALAGNRKFAARVASDTQRYGGTQIVSFPGAGFVAPNSADAILTFRNLHNWLSAGKAEAAFAQFYAALKPGGVLGIEDHRARTDLPEAQQLKSGYVREDAAIALAEAAGFKLVARSEVNANPRDTKDYPDGVWTLPPTYRLKDQDRARYAAIGESDRFTLKFIKPVN
jgi:predicted methyltransferase